jgi:hypothetical protein
MSELPDRPDLDQLRRRARELLRAATDGEPRAVGRIHAVSERVTLAAAQLAIAREHGYRSWPALKAEVDRRRSSASPAARPLAAGSAALSTADVLGQSWSLGGAGPIKTAAGVLTPEALIVGPDQAVIYASLTPADGAAPGTPKPRPGTPRPRRLPAPARPFARWARRRRARAAIGTIRAVAGWAGAVSVVDSSGRAYALRARGMSGRRGPAGEPRGPQSVELRLEPVPERDIAWIEVRGEDGTVTRLRPSPGSQARLGQLAPAPLEPAERALSDRARWLIELRLATAREDPGDMLRRQCAAALAKLAEIQRSGELDPGSQLPGQLEQLCRVLTGHELTEDGPTTQGLTEQGPTRQGPVGQGPAALPPSWSRMLAAAGASDGPSLHLDIGTTLPPIDGITVHVDSLFSAPERWRLSLRAAPGWWEYSDDRQRKWSPVSVLAEDDRGNSYLSIFGGSTGAEGHEELALEFLPRLDPLAHGLTLTFRGAHEQLAVDLRLDAAAARQP